MHTDRFPCAHCHNAHIHQAAESSPVQIRKVVHLINLAKDVVPYEQVLPKEARFVIILRNLTIPMCLYLQAWRWQQQLVAEVLRQQADTHDSRTSSGVLLLLQHDPVYTLGAGSTEAHLHFDPAAPPHPLYRTGAQACLSLLAAFQVSGIVSQKRIIPGHSHI